MMAYYINNLCKKSSNEMGKMIKSISPSAERVLEEAPDKLLLDISKKIQDFEGLVDSNNYFSNLVKNNPEITKLGNNIYKYKDYFINIGKRMNLTTHSIQLQRMRDLNLSSAPDIVAYSDLKNNMDCILITRIKNCSKSAPIPYHEAQEKVSLDAKNKLLADFDILAKSDIAPKSMLNKSNWFVVPETGEIVIPDWSDCIAFGDESSKVLLKNKLKDLCGLVY